MARSLIDHGYLTPDSSYSELRAGCKGISTTFLRGMLITWKEYSGHNRDKMVKMLKEVIEEREHNAESN